MLTAKMVKQAAMNSGADLVGITSMDRFEGAPKQQDPRYIFPGAKSCIMLAFRLPRGYFRGIEEGTYFAAYTSMGYGGMNQVYMPIVMREICVYIEDHGYEAAPVPNIYPRPSISFSTQKFAPEQSVPVAEGLPAPDVLLDYRIAAFAAGLGQFGYSKVFLTPEFGPMQRFVAILTDAELEPDPIYEGEICDRCMRCVGACSGKAISPTETESFMVAGKKVEYGKLDWMKCSLAYRGGNYQYNPFLSEEASLEECQNIYCGGPKLAQWCGYPSIYNHNPALEGARGCIRECYIHLEETGRLKKKFHNRFRQHKPWRLDGGLHKSNRNRIGTDMKKDGAE